MSSDSDDKSLKKGFLNRRRRSFYGKTTWNKQEFVLEKDNLISNDSKGKQKTTPLNKIKKIWVGPYKKKGDALQIETVSGTIVFTSDSKEELESWKESIEKQIELSKNGGQSSAEPPKPVRPKYLEDFEALSLIEKKADEVILEVKEKSTNKVFMMKGIDKKSMIEKNRKDLFVREREILSKHNHPFIANLYKTFQTNTRLYFLTAPLYLRLSTFIKQEKLTEKEIKFYASEIVCALDFLHSQNVVYRALNLDNVLIDEKGHVVLSGFHLSKQLEEGGKTKTFVGTPEYMPPELKMGEEVEYTKATDWWAFGTLLYRMFTGEFPFFISLKKLNPSEKGDFEKLQKLKNTEKVQIPKLGVGLEASDILVKLLEKDTSIRLQEAKKVKAAPFFKYVEWEKLAKKEIDPPITPKPVEKPSTQVSSIEENPASEDIHYIENFTYVYEPDTK